MGVIVELCEHLFHPIDKIPRTQYCVGSWPRTLRRPRLQHESLLQTARKDVGEAGSDIR